MSAFSFMATRSIKSGPLLHGDFWQFGANTSSKSRRWYRVPVWAIGLPIQTYPECNVRRRVKGRAS